MQSGRDRLLMMTPQRGEPLEDFLERYGLKARLVKVPVNDKKSILFSKLSKGIQQSCGWLLTTCSLVELMVATQRSDYWSAIGVEPKGSRSDWG